jgi:hypothetical protein
LLWNRALTIHISQRDFFLGILIEAMKDSETNRPFVQHLMDESTAQSLGFLSRLLDIVEPNLAAEIADFLFDKATSEQPVVDALTKALQNQLHPVIRTRLVRKCVHHIKESTSHRLNVLLLPRLLQNGMNAEMGDFERWFLDVLEFDRKLIFDSLAILYNRLNTGITIKQLQRLSTVLDDHFWGFLAQLLDFLGKEFVADDGFEFLWQLLNNYNFAEATQTSAHAIRLFVLIHNY